MQDDSIQGYAETLRISMQQLMDNAYLSSVPISFGKLYEPDEMQALFDLADEKRDV